MSNIAGGEPGAWGPTVDGGQRFGRSRRILMAIATVLAAAVVVVGVGGLALYRTADANLTRIPVSSLEGKDAGQALNVLLVGSDSRDGLSRQDELDLNLGSFDGQRSDTVILASVTPDHEGISLVSLPRDLIVYDDDGDRHKLAETFVHGPEHLVDIVSDNFGVPIHHYAEVSVTGFMGVVDTLETVEICLDEPLYDRKSGASFEAGCHDMSPEQALAYVRSRRGARGDFERIERQQQFMKAMVSQLVATDTLTDIPKLFAVIEEVADNVTTDDGLGLSTMRRLAEELRGLAGSGIPMTVVPSYTQPIGGKSYVVPYMPGAQRLFSSLRDGQALADRGSDAERADTHVAVWTGGSIQAADVVTRTLHWTGFSPYGGGRGEVDAGATTTVYVVPGFEAEASWVGATLGAPVQNLPAGVTAPDGAEVVVSAGDDALSGTDTYSRR
jgi:LCP family protein required for cell wall assembly